MATIKDKNKKVVITAKKMTLINIKTKTHQELESWAKRIKKENV